MGFIRRLIKESHRLSIRTKVLVMFLAIMGVVVYKISSSTHHYIVELQGENKVNEILSFAHTYLYSNADTFSLKTDLLAKEISGLGPTTKTFERISLESQAWEPVYRPDLLYYFDTSKNTLYSNNRVYNSENYQEIINNIMSLQAVQKALNGQEVNGFEIIPSAIVGSEGLMDMVRVPIVPTPNARAINYSIEERAMAMISAKPIYFDGQQHGVLVTAHILNNRFNLVDRFSGEYHVTTTIFMDNIRISTTVPNEDGERAVGTVLSVPVEDKVLVKGENYQGRAFVVNDWYITAYEPIRDIDNSVIGSLYVGLREAPLLQMQQNLDNEIKITLAILSLIFVSALYYLYRSIVIPLHKMSISAISFARGEQEIQIPTDNPNSCWLINQCEFTECPAYKNLNLKCWLLPQTKCCESSRTNRKNTCSHCKIYRQLSGNEIDQLADAFNYMAISIQENTRSLYELNLELEAKNNELTDQRDELECQKQQLMGLNRELEASLKALDDSQSIIYALAVAVEAKDPYTRGHSERVADYSVRLADALGVNISDFSIIRGAALLHDIGKIGISGTILRKPGLLTAIEFQQVKKHPGIGERICLSLKFARDMLPIIRHHHERFDGKGYPDGLKGEKIPLMARIVGVADAFDAMTSDRPYRPGMTIDDALSVLSQGAGTQWDPELVSIFIYMIKQGSSKNLVATTLEDNEEIVE
ncbi:HD domain-containing phosphohydrolase [Phosphitispora sp. TUW77]|uniref:HD domain-containing phosphohydrolase n=1 Tax=Phosphitispora sp. TUW77 TaxID=3152361 RepID=UPI003AB31504